MARLIAFVFVAAVCLTTAASFAASDMTPTAPEKMMPPAEKARLEACQKKAAQQHVEMHARAKFVMDCMKEMAK